MFDCRRDRPKGVVTWVEDGVWGRMRLGIVRLAWSCKTQFALVARGFLLMLMCKFLFLMSPILGCDFLRLLLFSFNVSLFWDVNLLFGEVVLC